MNEWIPPLVAGVLGATVTVLVWSALRRRQAEGSIALLQRELEALRKELRESLEGAGQRLDGRLDSTARLVGDVQNRLGELSEASRKIMEVGSNIASLQDILRTPKLRGGLGELLLEDLLTRLLPRDSFSVPHTFKSGQRVDAVVKVGPGLVPVDSKFPLENFRRALSARDEEEQTRARKLFASDVKRHVDAIRTKYILPDEGTYDFALMYIPAENVYYETIVREEDGTGEAIADYALRHHVVPVSPCSFTLYLKTILLGLKGLRVEEGALELVRKLQQLRGEVGRLQEEFGRLGTHLGHAQSSYEAAGRRLDRFAGKLADVEESRKELSDTGPEVRG